MTKVSELIVPDCGRRLMRMESRLGELASRATTTFSSAAGARVRPV